MSMIRNKYEAILLDLDGTLLDIDLDKFIGAYVKALSARFSAYMDHESFIAHLFGSTSVMVENNDPDSKNRDVFYRDFCKRIGLPYEDIKPVIDHFYEHDFPQLSCWGRRLPLARKVVETVQLKKLPLVLATNPIFPPAAVYQRLSWAGLKEEHFALITTMDNMHFCKPNPNYYAEIASKIECPPERCLMAGNDTLEDLIAARVGMDTFLVEDFILERENHKPVYNYRGSLQDFAEFLEQ